MEHARPPSELSLQGGPASRADTWRKWLKQFQVFLKASGVHKESDDVQASLLINLIGSEGYDIYTTFKFSTEAEREDIKILIEKFNNHFGSKTNTTMVRFKFFTRSQEPGECIDEYVTALRLLSQQCEFQHLEDGLIRDRIVCGITDAGVRDRLLRTDDLTLDKAIKICQANELSNEEGRQIETVKTEKSGSAAVDMVWNNRGARQRGKGRAEGRSRGFGGGPAAAAPVATPAPAAARACAACGNIYCYSEVRCPARNVKCFLCGAKGHYKKMCSVRKSSGVFELKEDSDEGELYYVSTIDSVDLVNTEENKWYESLYLLQCNSEHIFKLDTGSDLNVLSNNNYIKLGFSPLDITCENVRAQSFCGNYLSFVGSAIIKCMYKGNKYDIKFLISEHDCQSILGKNALEQLGLIKRIYSLNICDYDDLFKGLGKLPGHYKIPIDNNAHPCICPVRKIPIGVRDQLQKELKRMEDLGVIRKVTHPTSWVSGIVIAAKKDGSFRVCLDPRPLNRAIRRQHYPLPTLTEIATKLKGARYFSKLDARSGFWMIQLDDESADLCTFGTPFGRYQYMRLPYGINSASEIFHAKVRQLLEDLEGVDSFVDDVIVWGSSMEEHDRRLKGLLERAGQVGIKFNRDKCEFCVTEVTYLGHTFSIEGMKIDETKLKAIIDMPSPHDQQSLQRFLGMVNYVSKFIPNHSHKVSSLRNLLKKDNEWYWGDCEEHAIQQLKRELCAAPVLALFAAREPAVVSVDASAHALGAVLLQAGRPVEFASLTLTDTQQRYAQIEKEMLAIVFALERFHQYVFGKSDITVETDHKPLEALFLKSLDSVPARLQRMMLRVQRYDFSVVYKPGKYMYIADTLSRAPLPELLHAKVSEEVEEQTCYLLKNVRFSEDKLELVKQYTLSDIECQTLIRYLKIGWPSNKYEVEDCARAHWSYRESIEYVNGILFKNNLVFIPSGLRSEMLSRVHEGHLGIDRCKRRARDVMFWPGMSRDVEMVVRRCRVCAELAPLPQREPMIPHHIPGVPWNKIGSDIFEYNRKYFLILVDYFSNFVEVSPLTSITSKSVIAAMKDQFARHGIPHELITDNGPAYVSKEFKAFTHTWGFKHSTSSPNYPQSNGRSERAVRTIKTLISKSINSGDDFYIALLNYRSAPRDGIASPAQLMMGRRINTRLPAHSSKLQPDRDNCVDYRNIIRNSNNNKTWYDSRARPLPELTAGDEVVTADKGPRRSARVVARAEQPRSYLVADDRGRIFRRNRRHLIKLPDTPSPTTSMDRSMRSDDNSGRQIDSHLSNDDKPESDHYSSCTDSDEPRGTTTDHVGTTNNKKVSTRLERTAAREAKYKLKTLFK